MLKKFRFYPWVIVAMVGLILAACAQVPGVSDKNQATPTQIMKATDALVEKVKPTQFANITLTELDAGKTIHLQKGDYLKVTLSGNPTTGYNWEMAPANETVLALVGDPVFRADTGKLGSSGQISLTFEAKLEGRQDFQLVYHRLWEKNVPPTNSFEATIVVGGPDETSTPIAQAEPTAVPQPTPTTLIYPANGMKGWQTYTNNQYGFSLQYPPEWKMGPVFGTLTEHATLFTPANTNLARLAVSFQHPDENIPGRTGVGSGELMLFGKVLFMGKEINREVLVFEGKTMTVMYTCQGCMVRSNLTLGFDLDYLGKWTDPTGLPEDVLNLADLIVASVALAQ